MHCRNELGLLLLLAVCAWTEAAPIAKRMVDMTYTIGENTAHIKGHRKFQMDVLSNGTEGIWKIGEGIWMQIEEISSATHSGTHMDAPAHFKKGGLTIDQLDVSRFIAPAAVVDIVAKAERDPEAEATVEDLLHWEDVTGKSLNHTILLLKSGWGRKWDDKAAFFGNPDNDPRKMRFPGMSLAAAQWLVDNRNIYGLGVETLSFDKGSSSTFPVHQLLLGHDIFALENVANMDQIPIYGATLHVMPMKIGHSSGAPTRIVATFPDVIFDRHTDKLSRYGNEALKKCVYL